MRLVGTSVVYTDLGLILRARVIFEIISSNESTGYC